MATRPRITAALAQREFGALSRGQRARYRAVAGNANDRRSNPARHSAAMRAAHGGGRGTGSAGG